MLSGENMQNSLKWCFKLKDGLKILEQDDDLARSYLDEAKFSLKRAERNFLEDDLLWTTVVIYYAEYYALYSFLQKTGIKCENHFCSILAVENLLGLDKVKTINEHKNKRLDAQYYMRVGRREEIEKMLKEAKIFVNEFDMLVSNLKNSEIENYRKLIKNSLK